MVARYLEINKPKDTSRRYFKEAGYKYKTQRQDKEAENKMNEKEKENYQSSLYFKELLKQKSLDNINNKYEHYGYL